MDLTSRASLRKASALVLLIAVFCPRAASAMEIAFYERMAIQDQRDYLKYLVKNVEGILTKQGQQALAAKVHQLFRTVPAGEKQSLGAAQFEETLASIRAYDAENNFRFNVKIESVLYVMLQKNGVNLPHMLDKDLAQRQREKPFWATRPLRTN